MAAAKVLDKGVYIRVFLQGEGCQLQACNSAFRACFERRHGLSGQRQSHHLV